MFKDAIPKVVERWRAEGPAAGTGLSGFSGAARYLTNTAVAGIVAYEHGLFPSSLMLCIVVVARVFRACSVQPDAPLALSPRVSSRTRHGGARPGKPADPCPPPARFRNPPG